MVRASMAYTVLARKYRPQRFEELVGQAHVTRTLSNAIRAGRVAHAFLFTGVRGVGKTTMARLLAKALNCEHGPTPEPCGECDHCVGITSGRSPDVLEMDGASNNSVDDVRRLQESLPYRPQSGRFKVVIVDEVHMLSTGAFNAFLKTLEEPPDHVKFIFATTEAHKVPVTIRSRCQRYDFRLIPQRVVTDRVREILEAESVTADDDTVAIVSREAAGSMRDALTLLDQIMAFGGDNLVGTEVAQVLGIADRELVHGIAESVLSGDGGRVLTLVDELAGRGLDMLHFSRQLLELVRDMVVLRVSGEQTELVALVPEERARASAAANSVDLQELHRAFSALSRVVEDVAQSGAPRTTLEMGLVRLATRPPLLPMAELVARLDAMERRGGGGGGGSRAAGSGSGGPSGGARGRPGGARAAADTGARSAATATPEPPGPTSDEPPPRTARPDATAAQPPEPRPTKAPAVEAVPEAITSPSPRTPSPRTPAPQTVAPAPKPQGAPRGEPADREPAVSGPSSSASGDAPSWATFVQAVINRQPALGAVLEHGTPVRLAADGVVLGFPKGSFVAKQANTRTNLKLIGDTAEALFGVRPSVEVIESDAASEAPTLVEAENERRETRRREAEQRARAHPLVVEAAALFSLPQEAMTVHLELK